MPTILVTGGVGYIGSHIVQALALITSKGILTRIIHKMIALCAV